MDDSIDICAVELAGRGRRYNEPLYDNLNEAVDDIYSMIKNELDCYPYALFGHSMGSIIAYELCHKIRDLGYQNPTHVFLSGHSAPNMKKDKTIVYKLPDVDFKKEIIKLGGTPAEVLENKELLDILLPMLRSDFKIIETYEYVKKDKKMDCDITVFAGKEDDFMLNEILEWKNHTNKKCKVHMYEGGHFFINEYLDSIVNIINGTLLI